MVITPRQETIMRTIVREHIRTGAPVGSAVLCGRAGLFWSAATIRGDLADLEESGLLRHPYTSAGRVPTTRGFRYYVDHCLRRTPSPRASAVFRRVASHEEVTAKLAKELARTLADLANTLAVVATPDTTFHEAGIGRLIRMREFTEEEALVDVERLLDTLESEEEDVSVFSSETPTVFINGENPLVASDRTSMVICTPRLPSGESLLVALIGPVRMPYDHHLRLLDALRHALTEHASPA